CAMKGSNYGSNYDYW
nr:immunoglobulin heavy chain junction region [Macaca mulatta]